MGLKNRAEEEDRSMNEALLVATMCIIDLPVDLHLKDGSVYSGIFHTASVEKEYGIVLKKAKLTKKGRCATNVAIGSVVETLVILAGDFVQVVAKGVPLPFDGFSRNIAHANGEAIKSLSSSAPVNGTKKFNRSIMDKRKNNRKSFTSARTGKDHEGKNLPQDPMGNAKEVEHQQRDGTNIEQGEDAFIVTGVGRQVGDDRLQLLQDEYEQKLELHMEESAKEVKHSAPNLDTFVTQVEVEEGHNEMTSKLLQNGSPHNAPVDDKLDNQCSERPTATDASQEAVCYGVSASSSPVRDVSSELCQSSLASPAATVPTQSSESNKNSKEFKLNPRAKIFSPSFASAISAAPSVAPTVANGPYIPSNSPVVTVAGSQPEVRVGTFAPRSPAPSKFFSYSNITPANGVSGSQFSQPPIVGQMGSRTQPLRYTGQYHPVQAAPSYLNPNSQAVMFGRFGQFVYIPVSHDLVQGAAAISPVPARPPLTQHHVQFPKQQGSLPGQALQFRVPQPFISGGQQRLAVAPAPHLLPPFPVNHPIQVPGPNGLYSSKRP